MDIFSKSFSKPNVEVIRMTQELGVKLDGVSKKIKKKGLISTLGPE